MSRAKRPREEETVLDGDNDDAEALSSDDEKVGVGSSKDDEDESSSEDSGFEDIGSSMAKEPLEDLVLPILQRMLPLETTAVCLSRLKQEQRDDDFNVVSDCIAKSLLQHDVQPLTMTREALCKKLLVVLRGSKPLPAMWILRWDRDATQKIHGPFSHAEMNNWAKAGFFLKKKAMVRNVNETSLGGGDVWAEATTIDFTI